MFSLSNLPSLQHNCIRQHEQEQIMRKPKKSWEHPVGANHSCFLKKKVMRKVEMTMESYTVTNFASDFFFEQIGKSSTFQLSRGRISPLICIIQKMHRAPCKDSICQDFVSMLTFFYSSRRTNSNIYPGLCKISNHQTPTIILFSEQKNMTFL